MKRFAIPLQSEVSKYMREKKGWPQIFCDYYAEKFWNHYQASGWKLSSGNLIKDWKACFNSQWQSFKFKEDIEMFQKCGGKSEPAKIIPIKQTDSSIPLEITELDDALANYMKPTRSIKYNDLYQFYETIKRYRLWNPELTVKDMGEISKVYNNDPVKCKCAIVDNTFAWYGNRGWLFSDTLKLRNKIAR